MWLAIDFDEVGREQHRVDGAAGCAVGTPRLSANRSVDVGQKLRAYLRIHPLSNAGRDRKSFVAELAAS